MSEEIHKALEGFNSDRPLVLGGIRGYRSFQVTEEGKLTGVTYNDYVWKDGLNTGHCPANEIATKTRELREKFAQLRISLALPDLVEDLPLEEHRVGSQDCSCGFYAYHKSSVTAFHANNQVRAIIEGQGLVTVGDKGFRAEKARILGFLDPEGLNQKRTFHDIFVIVVVILWILSIIGRGLDFFLDPFSWSSFITGLLFTLLHTATVIFILKMKRQEKQRLAKQKEEGEALKEKVTAAYPIIPWYKSPKDFKKAAPKP